MHMRSVKGMLAVQLPPLLLVSAPLLVVQFLLMLVLLPLLLGLLLLQLQAGLAMVLMQRPCHLRLAPAP